MGKKGRPSSRALAGGDRFLAVGPAEHHPHTFAGEAFDIGPCLFRTRGGIEAHQLQRPAQQAALAIDLVYGEQGTAAQFEAFGLVVAGLGVVQAEADRFGGQQPGRMGEQQQHDQNVAEHGSFPYERAVRCKSQAWPAKYSYQAKTLRLPCWPGVIARPAGPDFRAWQAGIATKGLVKSVLRAIVGKTGRTKNFDQTGRISRRQQ